MNGGTNGNRPSVAVDLNETSLEAGIIAIGKWTDERGLKIAARPQKLVIPDLQFVAERLMQSELSTTAGGSNAFMKTTSTRLSRCRRFQVVTWLTTT